MTTQDGGVPPTSVANRQRKLEALLARGNALERTGDLQAARLVCKMALAILRRSGAYRAGEQRVFDEDYEREAWARALLLTANVAARLSTALTSELHLAYKRAIAAARMVRVGGTHEGRALRAYGAVLAYYKQLDEAKTTLEMAFQFLARDEKLGFYESELWVLTGTQIAEVLVEQGKTNDAITVLESVTRLIGAQHISTTHADDLAAAALLAVLLYRRGHSADIRRALDIRRRIIARLKLADPGRQNKHYAAIWRMRFWGPWGLLAYNVYLRRRPRLLRS